MAGGLDPAVDGCVGDDAALPHALDQIVLADDAIAVLQQIEQQVEDLRLDRYRLAGPAEFPPRRVQHVIANTNAHDRVLYGNSGFLPQQSGIPEGKSQRAGKRAGTGTTTVNREQSVMWRGDSPMTLPITRNGLPFAVSTFSDAVGLSIAGL